MLKYSEFSLQILDRKNDEIDVLKSNYLKKQKESEDMIRKLEKKGDFYPPGCLLCGGIVLHSLVAVGLRVPSADIPFFIICSSLFNVFSFGF